MFHDDYKCSAAPDHTARRHAWHNERCVYCGESKPAADLVAIGEKLDRIADLLEMLARDKGLIE